MMILPIIGLVCGTLLIYVGSYKQEMFIDWCEPFDFTITGVVLVAVCLILIAENLGFLPINQHGQILSVIKHTVNK